MKIIRDVRATEGQLIHHRNMALVFWLLSWVMATIGGIMFSFAEHISVDHGIYWALATVTTVGYGDIIPTNGLGYVLADVTMVLTIPIWSLAVAFATSWFTSLHIWESHSQLKTHVTDSVAK